MYEAKVAREVNVRKGSGRSSREFWISSFEGPILELSDDYLKVIYCLHLPPFGLDHEIF